MTLGMVPIAASVAELVCPVHGTHYADGSDGIFAICLKCSVDAGVTLTEKGQRIFDEMERNAPVPAAPELGLPGFALKADRIAEIIDGLTTDPALKWRLAKAFTAAFGDDFPADEFAIAVMGLNDQEEAST